MRPSQVASPERIEAIQDGLRALWAGESAVARGLNSPVRAVENGKGHRYVPLFAHGELRIGLGTVTANGMTTYYPEFEGAKINASIAPFITVSSLTADDYKIILKGNSATAKIEVLQVAVEPERTSGDWVIVLATFTKGEAGAVSDVKHLWRSDVMHVASGPFMPLLRSVSEVVEAVETVTWEVGLTPGLVVERCLLESSPTYHVPTGLVGAGGIPVWTPITSGQAVYVKLEVNVAGAIEGDPVVAVDADEVEGAHYYPEVFTYLGVVGEHNYKMFVFTLVDDLPVIEIFCSGDHVHHYAERSTWKNRTEVSGTTRVVGDLYDPVTDVYWLKVLRQVATGKPIMKPLAGAETAQKSIDFRGLKERPSGTPQIKITAADADEDITIEGNGKIGALTWTNCEGTTVTLLEWDDGLIITEGVQNITAGCTDSGSGGGIL